MSNHFGSPAWAAACPRTSVPSPRRGASLSRVGYPTAESLRVRPDGVKRVEQHVFTELAALWVNAQVKDTGIRMPLGPYPWRPPE